MNGILMTGASGFIGRQVALRLIADGRDITIAGRHNPFADQPDLVDQVRFVAIDAIGPDTDWRPALEGCRSLVHLAAQVPVRGIEDRAFDLVNVQGTGRLVQQAKAAGVQRFIFASSIFAVTSAANDAIVDDQTVPQPMTAYGRSKLAAEQSVAAFAGDRRAAISLRLPMVYGARASGNWARLMQLSALPLPLPFALAHNRRSMLAVENAVDAILCAESNATPENSGAYAISECEALDLATVVTLLRRARGKSANLLPMPPRMFQALAKGVGQSGLADSLLGSLVIDGSRFASKFGWRPSVETAAAIQAAATSAGGKNAMGQRRESVTKRGLDIVVAATGLVLLSPLILVLAVLVRTTSQGKAIFVQNRVGRDEKSFACYKFRTMTSGAPNAGSHQVGDSWITPFGRNLRRFKLDEIPQLFNVLRGDMSLVGPRPCLPVQDDVIAARRRHNVFSVRPGITGLAQLRGIDMSTPDKLAETDRTYIDSHSLTGDIRLLFNTLTGAGRGDAASSRN